MQISRRISSYDTGRAIRKTRRNRRLNLMNSKSHGLKARLNAAGDDLLMAAQIYLAYAETREYEYSPQDDTDLIQVTSTRMDVDRSSMENDPNRIILNVDSTEYRQGVGRSIWIRTRPQPDGIKLYVMITADTGQIENGYAKKCTDKHCWWVYTAKIRRPALFDMAICLWALDDVDVLEEAIAVG